MKEDILRELGRLNTFLGTALTENQLQTVAHHTSFSGMKSRGTTNPTAALQESGEFKKGEAEFIRKGGTQQPNEGGTLRDVTLSVYSAVPLCHVFIYFTLDSSPLCY